MATKQKTTRWGFPTDIASLANNARRDLAAITIYIPETIVAFRSVEIRVFCTDDATAISNGIPTSWLLGIKLGAVAFSDATVASVIANSGEAQSYEFTRDVTSYFTTNWSGTSMTCQVGFLSATGTSVPTQNHCAEVWITYDYDDTSATHIKTVCIPIESTRSILTTTYQTLGGATAIPALTGAGTYLPEASRTIRRIELHLWANTAMSGSTDYTVQYRINAGADNTFQDVEAAQSSHTWFRAIADITALDLSAARSLEVRTVTTTSRVAQIGGMVVVTYEFNPSTTTTVFNSLVLGALDIAGWAGGTADGDRQEWTRTIFVEEPGTITLKESAACLFVKGTGSFTLNVGVGGQTSQAYLNPLVTGINCGQGSLVHRFDAGGQVGAAGITLARGKNTYTIKVRSSTTVDGNYLSGFIILNYTSGKAAGGVSTHAQSCYKSLANTAADAIARQVAPGTAPAIPDATYWLVGATVLLTAMQRNLGGTSLVVLAERAAGEASGAGWEDLYIASGVSDNENELITAWGASRSAWLRYPTDPDTDRMDIETVRDYRVDSQPASWWGLGLWYTFHTLSANITGTISGSAGGTVNIRAYRRDTGELIGTAQRTGNGSYSIPWYDDTLTIDVEAYESTSKKGRANEGVGGGTFNIDLNAPGGGGGGILVHPGTSGGARG